MHILNQCRWRVGLAYPMRFRNGGHSPRQTSSCDFPLMAEFPAFPLWTDAYLGDTRHLTAAQHGAYLLLLITAWRTTDCSLPDDDGNLSKWSCMGMKTWLKNKKVIMDFWDLENGRWTQAKQIEVRKKVIVNSSQKSHAGYVSGLKRKERSERLYDSRTNGERTNQNQNHNKGNFKGRRSESKSPYKKGERWKNALL